MSHIDVSWILADEFLKPILSLFIFHIGMNFIWTDNIEGRQQPELLLLGLQEKNYCSTGTVLTFYRWADVPPHFSARVHI